MADALDVLGRLSGLPRPEMVALAEQVKANHALLRGCAFHDFAPLPTHGDRLRRRYRCKACGGEVDAHAWYWHEQGRRPAPDAQSGGGSG